VTIEILLLIFCCGTLIVGAVMTIYQSAKKFKLTEQQMINIKNREQEQQKKDSEMESNEREK